MTDETLADMTFELDALLTRIEGTASALTGLNCDEAPRQVGPGRAWLAGVNKGLVDELRELSNALFEASHGPKPPLKAVGE